MALTEDEKDRCRYHLGTLGVQAASTFVLGIPAGVQTQFMIEGAFDRLLPSAEKRVRKLLERLDKIEDQIEDNMENLAADAVGEITLRKDEFKELIKRYLWWRASLANRFGVEPNPFDQRFMSWLGGGGGVNVRVSG